MNGIENQPQGVWAVQATIRGVVLQGLGGISGERRDGTRCVHAIATPAGQFDVLWSAGSLARDPPGSKGERLCQEVDKCAPGLLRRLPEGQDPIAMATHH